MFVCLFLRRCFSSERPISHQKRISGPYTLALNQSFSQRLDVDESRAGWQRPFRDFSLTRGDFGGVGCGFESSSRCQLCRGCCCGFYLIYFALPSFILFSLLCISLLPSLSLFISDLEISLW